MSGALTQMATSVSFRKYWKLAMTAMKNTKVGKFCNHLAVILLFALIQIAGPIFEVIAGVMTYQVCPAQPYLPIYAIFAGVSCIVMCTYGLILQLVERRKNSKTELITEAASTLMNVAPIPTKKSICLTIAKIIQLVIVIASIAWFICGNVWVWSMVPCTSTQLDTNNATGCFSSNITYINGSDFFCHPFIYQVVLNGMFVKYSIIGLVFIVAALFYIPICCVYYCAKK